ncbi:hypothetical protein K9N68_27905 [Kovacikia minuta CCNUW1]|uniref:hypothetical protein n=1 Tax=Kovacikia minuta TaxID=2931930 RepID=UPI001CCEA6F4|nr:hypothetical protein [Kovacikia minuta]UBF25385.1 hypothetical protein K9N68_27905 [Kovacikia minuta CCNUW1]
MSQSSLPKNLPDFFRQENLDKTLEILRQPFSLAILASLGVHGLLWAILPLLPEAKPPEPTPEAVKVVELSPADQARIPELANPQINFPPISNQTKLPSQSPKAPATKAPPSIFDDSLYNFPALPPAPVPIFPDINIPIIDSPRHTTGVKLPNPSPTPTAKPSPSPSPTSTSQPGAATPSPTPSVPSTRPEKIPDKAIIALREQQEKIRREREQSPTGPVTQGEATKQFQEWLSRTAQAQSIPVDVLSGSLQKPRDIQIPCPTGACPEKAARVAALFLAAESRRKSHWGTADVLNR